MQALGENNRGAANSDIPLAKHWLPADTFSSPLDGSPQLRHQLEKLARVFTKYERALILYEARSGIPGARRKSKGNKINLAIELVRQQLPSGGPEAAAVHVQQMQQHEPPPVLH